MKDELKKNLIKHAFDLTKDVSLSVIKSKKEAKKPKKKENKKVKFAFKLLKKALYYVVVKELVIDRVKAKLNPKPSVKDFSWLLEYPIREELVGLSHLVNDLNEKEQVLDLGSGAGYFAVEVAKKLKDGGKVTCVDLSNDALKRLKDKFGDEGEGLSNVELHRADIQSLPFDDNKFDSIFLNMTIGQIPNKLKALSEIKRVLKDNGKLYITELLIDHHYCLPSTVLAYANSSGFKPTQENGHFINYTIVFEKI